MKGAIIRAGHLNRRELFAVAGAAVSYAALPPSLAWATIPVDGSSAITDMTMNSPPYATQIGYGRPDHLHDGADPLDFAFYT